MAMRHVHQINDSWKFHHGELEQAQAHEYNALDWDNVVLPHDWSIAGPFDSKWASATAYLPCGVGWYRREMILPKQWDGRRIYLHFDGVCNNSSVWVNGLHVGDRPNGFIPFRYDITSFLRPNSPNTIAVRCDHSKFADSRWYTGSGINRNVYLIATDHVNIKQWGSFAATTALSDGRATLSVQSTIQNHKELAAAARIEHILLDPNGKVVAEARASREIAPGESAEVHCQLIVEAAEPWSVDAPALYTIQTRVYDRGEISDCEETRIGLRVIHFDAQSGFTLNGKNLKLKGVCIHDDAGALGTAVPGGVWERRLLSLKECGVNAIRMAHNPHMPELYDLCDEIGLLVQDEAFDEWNYGKNKWVAGWNVGQPANDGYGTHFSEWAEADLRDMILSNRNHPSIIMWSIGNEIDYPNDPYTHEILNQGASPQIFGSGYRPQNPHAGRLRETAESLVKIAKQHDHTRPITAALASALMSNEGGYPDVLDIVGYNYQEFRYEADHASYPNRVLYGSENGMLEACWNAVASNPYICGQFLWTGIDYLGEAHGWPERSNRAGLMDLAGFPKPEYYYRKSLWTDEPMVYLGACKLSAFTGKQGLWDQYKARPVWSGDRGETIRVQCFTNCMSAELFCNGRTQGRKNRSDAAEGVIFWDVAYEPGEIMVEAFNEDAVVARDRVVTTGSPVKLVAQSDKQFLTTTSEDVAHVDVYVVDADGNRIQDSEFVVAWSIEGDGRLLGLESGDHASHESYLSNSRRTSHGRLLGYIKATAPKGSIKITLTSPGLESAVVAITTTTGSPSTL